MLGRWVCQRTVEGVNQRLNQEFPQTFFEESFNPEDARIPGPEIVGPEEWTIDTMTTMIVRLGLSDWISPVGDTILEKKPKR